jgi:hypothetical protein
MNGGAMTSFSFHPDHDGSLSLESAVYQAIGAASMCWTWTGSQAQDRIFDSDRAKVIADSLIAFINT